MSEEATRPEPREGQRTRQFGHVLLQTHLGEVFSLDLFEIYETPDTMRPDYIFSGSYLLPTGDMVTWLLRNWERIGLEAVPRSLPVEVVLSADAEALNALGDMFYGGRYPDEWQEPPSTFDSPFSGSFQLRGPQRGDFHDMYAQVSPAIRRNGRTSWAGTLGGKGTRASGEFGFLLDQYGTMESLFLLVLIFFFGFSPEPIAQATARCHQQAVFQCGDEGNVKAVNVSRGIVGASFGLSGSCHIECFERWHPGGSP